MAEAKISKLETESTMAIEAAKTATEEARNEKETAEKNYSEVNSKVKVLEGEKVCRCDIFMQITMHIDMYALI